MVQIMIEVKKFSEKGFINFFHTLAYQSFEMNLKLRSVHSVPCLLKGGVKEDYIGLTCLLLVQCS